MNTSQLVDVVCRLFNNREQWQKQGDVKQNAIFLVAALESSNLPGGSVVKNPPINVGDLQETRVLSLGQEDPLEEEMATHSNILAWKIPWTEEPGGLQSMGSQRVGHN